VLLQSYRASEVFEIINKPIDQLYILDLIRAGHMH
jgi:hypothetical protein